jgi:hypothetical protein
MNPTNTAVPVSHQDHPFWHFNWTLFLQVLQVAATIAPAVVAIADKQDPSAVAAATQLSALTNSVLNGINAPAQNSTT